ncbi:MAG: hypothetical protein ACK5XN_36010 [Bacteroidota bacterium]|jgi:hypothetical protein
MKFEIDSSSMTIDGLIAYHSADKKSIVGVTYTLDSQTAHHIDSEDPNTILPTLELWIDDGLQYYKLRYIHINNLWHLQAVSIDTAYYRLRPSRKDLELVFDMIRAADIVKARV